MDEALKTTPLVSIMMATYNRADYIGAAIASARAQTYGNWELLVLDDGGSDNTAEVVKGLAAHDSRILYLPSPTNLGITNNRNRGLTFARGKYIAVLDSDDLWIDPEKLRKQVSFLEDHAEYILVGTNVQVIDTEGHKIGTFTYETADDAIRAVLLKRNQFTHSSLLLRLAALKNEAYDPSVPIWEDYDLVLRLGLRGKLANLPEAMTAYRQHSNNVSRKNRKSGALTHLAIIRRYKKEYPGYLMALMKGYLRLLWS